MKINITPAMAKVGWARHSDPTDPIMDNCITKVSSVDNKRYFMLWDEKRGLYSLLNQPVGNKGNDQRHLVWDATTVSRLLLVFSYGLFRSDVDSARNKRQHGR